MKCSPHDLRDYLFEELGEPDRRAVDSHLKACAGCREELDGLRVTRSALGVLPEEEIPQRIAFVSDRVYEPSILRRWWTAFWASGPRLVFASAAMLSVAIVTASLQHRPAAAPPPAQVDVAAVKLEIAAAVEKAVAANREETARITAASIAASEDRLRKQYKQDQDMIASTLAIWDKTYKTQMRASLYGGGQ